MVKQIAAIDFVTVNMLKKTAHCTQANDYPGFSKNKESMEFSQHVTWALDLVRFHNQRLLGLTSKLRSNLQEGAAGTGSHSFGSWHPFL